MPILTSHEPLGYHCRLPIEHFSDAQTFVFLTLNLLHAHINIVYAASVRIGLELRNANVKCDLATTNIEARGETQNGCL